MARTNEPVDEGAGRRLLQNKLKLLQGLAGTRRSSLALDILTGRTAPPTYEETQADSESTPASDVVQADVEPDSAPVTVVEEVVEPAEAPIRPRREVVTPPAVVEPGAERASITSVERVAVSVERVALAEQAAEIEPAMARVPTTVAQPSTVAGQEREMKLVAAAEPPAREEPAVPPVPARVRRVRRIFRARTVYLSDQEIRDVEFIIRAWRRRLQKRVSRSEVLRQAIGNLRDAVELGAAPQTRSSAQRERENYEQHG